VGEVFFGYGLGIYREYEFTCSVLYGTVYNSRHLHGMALFGPIVASQPVRWWHHHHTKLGYLLIYIMFMYTVCCICEHPLLPDILSHMNFDNKDEKMSSLKLHETTLYLQTLTKTTVLLIFFITFYGLRRGL
jgi:hypothetical protein